jgi:7-cyano-7-deazaguanine synthase
MNQKNSHSKKQAVLSLSGGMDSSTLLLHLLANDYEVTALSFDYGQKHKVELERATDLVQYINQTLFTNKPVRDRAAGFKIDYPVKHQIIKLDGLAQLLNSSLVEGGSEVPEGHYAAENMKDTVVPNRNKIFSSIIQAVALSIADKKSTECSIAMGIHAGDHAIYPDCRQDFRDADFDAFIIGNWGSENVNIYTPYIDTDKFGILQDGEICCKTLGLDFDEVYYRTNTSYKPIYIPVQKLSGMSGNWYSDYKSASSVERIEAFIKLGRPDPCEYADETGPVSWETARIYVEQVISEYAKEQLNIN